MLPDRPWADIAGLKMGWGVGKGFIPSIHTYMPNTVPSVYYSSVFRGLGCRHSPNPRKEAAEEESAVTLDEGREEGEDTVD